jgi:hypothetical protein
MQFKIKINFRNKQRFIILEVGSETRTTSLNNWFSKDGLDRWGELSQIAPIHLAAMIEEHIDQAVEYSNIFQVGASDAHH